MLESILMSADGRIASFLLDRGCPSSVKGYHQIKACLIGVECDATLLESINKLLYDKAASEFNTSVKCVERNIRTLIDIWWRGKMKNWWDGDKKPTSKECIVKLSELIRAENMRAENVRPDVHITVYEKLFG